MTVDEALDKAMRKLDAILEQRLFDLELSMVAQGCTDFDGIEEVVRQQREIDAQWRTTTVVDLRRQFEQNL